MSTMERIIETSADVEYAVEELLEHYEAYSDGLPGGLSLEGLVRITPPRDLRRYTALSARQRAQALCIAEAQL